MDGFWWLRPAVLETADYTFSCYEAVYRTSDRIPCDDETVEISMVLRHDIVLPASLVAPKHAAFPARALGASWSIAALVGE